MSEKNTYTISEVAAILGVNVKTLRRWESKGTINPLRTLGNQRRYNEIDIAILKQKLQKVTPYLPESSQDIHPFTKEDLVAKMGVSSQTVNRWQEHRPGESTQTGGLLGQLLGWLPIGGRSINEAMLIELLKQLKPTQMKVICVSISRTLHVF